MLYAQPQNNQHLEIITCASFSKLFKKLKNGIEILVGQAVLKLWIKIVKMLFGSIILRTLGLSKFDAIFEFFG